MNALQNEPEIPAVNPLALIDGQNPIEQPQQQVVEQQGFANAQPTKFFSKAYTNFTAINAVQLFYSFSKLSIGVWLLVYFFRWPGCFVNYPLWFLGFNAGPIEQWTFWMILHSFFSCWYYYMMVKWLSIEPNRIRVAERLGEVVQGIEQDRQQSVSEESKRISILSMQIKYELQKQNCCSKWVGRLCFVAFQLLFFWGMIIFFRDYHNFSGCEEWIFRYMVFIIFMGIYQYIDFYIIIILGALCSPFLIVFFIYYLCSLCQKNQENERVMMALEVTKYKPNQIEGDSQCSICYTAYEVDEELIILKCSRLHHFHASCIRAWIQVNRTCPLCRHGIDPE